MQPVWLFRVVDAFNVRGNGWVLLPGVRRDGPEVRAGDALELRGGKGPDRTATVKAVGTFAPKRDEGDGGDAMPLLIELDPTDRPLLVERVSASGGPRAGSAGRGGGAEGDAQLIDAEVWRV